MLALLPLLAACLIAQPWCQYNLLANAQESSPCPPGWAFYNGSCYQCVDKNVTSTQAASDCQGSQPGASLACIGSQGEDTFIRGLCTAVFPQPPQSPAFIRITQGLRLTRDASCNIINATCPDGSPCPNYGCPNVVGCTGCNCTGCFPWADGKAWLGWTGPGSTGPPEPKPNCSVDCVALLYNNKNAWNWAAQPCNGSATQRGGYICKFPLASQPAQPSPNSCPCNPGWTKFNGSCWRAFNSTTDNCTTAQQACQARGANLASVHSWAEQNFIAGLIAILIPDPPKAINFTRVFLGILITVDSNGCITSLTWTDGTPFDFGNPGAPGCNYTRGQKPWSDGKSTNTNPVVPEPKNSTLAKCGFAVKNNQSAADWAVGPSQFTADPFTGPYICKMCPAGTSSVNGSCVQQSVCCACNSSNGCITQLSSANQCPSCPTGGVPNCTPCPAGAMCSNNSACGPVCLVRRTTTPPPQLCCACNGSTGCTAGNTSVGCPNGTTGSCIPACPPGAICSSNGSCAPVCFVPRTTTVPVTSSVAPPATTSMSLPAQRLCCSCANPPNSCMAGDLSGSGNSFCPSTSNPPPVQNCMSSMCPQGFQCIANQTGGCSPSCEQMSGTFMAVSG